MCKVVIEYLNRQVVNNEWALVKLLEYRIIIRKLRWSLLLGNGSYIMDIGY